MTQEITPIFVIGAPRSGTTFLASSIGGHPDIVSLPELHFLFQMMEEEIVLGPLKTDRKVELLNADFYFRSLQLFDTRGQLVGCVEGKGVKSLALDIVRRFNEKNEQKEYSLWVEHSSYSHLYIHMIKQVFPNARFVHSVRDPRAVYSSTVQVPWGYRDVVTGANAWKKVVTDILSKERYFDVHSTKYEDLIVSPEVEMRRVSTYLDIEFDKGMLTNNGLDLPNYFGRPNVVAGEGADSARMDKWKLSLARKEIEHINAVCYDLMDKLGYVDASMKRVEIRGIERHLRKLKGRIVQKYARKKFENERRELFCLLK